MEQKKGKVYLVGAGPGDPDLITVKAIKFIQLADVIVYDRLVNPVLLKYAKHDGEIIYCGKEPGNHCVSQDAIHELLLDKAMAGKSVVRLKGGDPFVFGRGGEEAMVLAEYGIEFEVVPGITSGIAAPAYAGIPVTYRDVSQSFAVVTGHCVSGKPKNIRWDYLAQGVDTLAIYMGIKNLPYICSQLELCGKDPHTPVAVIQQGTTGEQRTVIGTLETITNIVEENRMSNPSIIIIGEVVNLSSKLAWFPEKIRIPAK
ncbi:uroporphyrinogen-III C-methyltransferase [Neobacillus niacini]|uniref:uroporphyrinogen-III C-methyltransferase n=1 Tax=Neobacillus niacini TaxID=86668 RepID=UPI002855D458|nr:uroporphyrinogen-III C-methyltransferase [Neobacillus niacini]MDR7000105.1 uroporphyrin-III C-methyltransferase [Neobacillus niacini]